LRLHPVLQSDDYSPQTAVSANTESIAFRQGIWKHSHDPSPTSSKPSIPPVPARVALQSSKEIVWQPPKDVLPKPVLPTAARPISVDLEQFVMVRPRPPRESIDQARSQSRRREQVSSTLDFANMAPIVPVMPPAPNANANARQRGRQQGPTAFPPPVSNAPPPTQSAAQARIVPSRSATPVAPARPSRPTTPHAPYDVTGFTPVETPKASRRPVAF
jgi:hypothetical protein